MLPDSYLGIIRNIGIGRFFFKLIDGCKDNKIMLKYVRFIENVEMSEMEADMARPVSIGAQDFEEIISKNCFYVDKTGVIRE